ncbi:MAG: protein-S-isoprenylcysteine O-methyltransferase [Xanthobacteraceae bacterium]
MTLIAAKWIWAAGCIAWFIIRYPHQRRSRKTQIVSRSARMRERILLGVSFCGLFIIPLIYVVSSQPKVFSYGFQPVLAWLGTAVFAGSLALFYRTHRDLGRSWSVTLELRDQHALITHGVYNWVRHPMYSAFWLWAIAQALLLPNWIAGLSGLVGFGTLYFGRVGHEERMMLEAFGDGYRDYMARTRRIVPGMF